MKGKNTLSNHGWLLVFVFIWSGTCGEIDCCLVCQCDVLLGKVINHWPLKFVFLLLLGSQALGLLSIVIKLVHVQFNFIVTETGQFHWIWFCYFTTFMIMCPLTTFCNEKMQNKNIQFHSTKLDFSCSWIINTWLSCVDLNSILNEIWSFCAVLTFICYKH